MNENDQERNQIDHVAGLFRYAAAARNVRIPCDVDGQPLANEHDYDHRQLGLYVALADAHQRVVHKRHRTAAARLCCLAVLATATRPVGSRCRLVAVVVVVCIHLGGEPVAQRAQDGRVERHDEHERQHDHARLHAHERGGGHEAVAALRLVDRRVKVGVHVVVDESEVDTERGEPNDTCASLGHAERSVRSAYAGKVHDRTDIGRRASRGGVVSRGRRSSPVVHVFNRLGHLQPDRGRHIEYKCRRCPDGARLSR